MMSSLHWPESLRRLRAAWAPALAAALFAALFAMAAPAHAVGNVVISQVYGGGGNTGATIKNDFIEIYNRSGAAVNIGGWSVQYAGATGTTWQVTNIPAGTVVPAGSYFLVKEAAGANTAAIDINADVTGTIPMSSTAGKVALVSSTTALSGANPTTAVDLVGYGSTATGFEGAGPAPGLSNTLAAIRAGGGATDTDNNSADFTTGPPAPRYSGGDAIPGGGGGGGSCAATTGDPTAAIYTIQGTGGTSPLVGQTVTTSGVVTKLANNGFFIQDSVGDGNPQTSDGIFVFASPVTCVNAVVGNLVTVAGTVSEFAPGAGTASTPLTEITAVIGVGLRGSGTIIPTVVTLPLAAGDSFERFEGMLVTLQGTLTVQQNFFQAQYGQVTIGVGRHETPTNAYRPNSTQALALADLQARSRLLLDDSSSTTNPNPTPYFNAAGLGRAGDTVSNLTGVIDFGLATATASGAGLYRIQPTSTPVFTSANPRTAAPPAVGGNLRIGAMNVLNFFTTFTNGATAFGGSGQGCTLGGSTAAANCRGADNITEYTRQRDKIVREMAGLNADAVGLMETQNNGNTAVQALVDALNTFVGASVYAAIPVPAAGTGTDAIRVTMIYKPARLATVGLPMSDTDAVNNRPTLAQTFMAANGEKFSLVVNHLKSKSGCPSGTGGDADAGDGQGCWNATRLTQAQRLRTFVAQVQAAAGSNDVLLVGDFNAYAKEDPIFDLTSNGYIDQIGRFNALGYSYVFDGSAGRLDHAIATATLSSRVTSAVEWHINADESVAFDYNLENKQPACATCAPDPYDGSGPYRASDHDPVLVGVNLYKTFNGTAGRDIIVGSAGDDIIYGGPGADTLTGGGGNNIFLYTSIRDAGDTITDFVPGKDVLDVGALLTSLGYTGSDPIADGWLRFVALSRNATSVEIDADGPGPGVSRSLVTLLGVNISTLVGARDLKLATPPGSRTGPRRMTVAR